MKRTKVHPRQARTFFVGVAGVAGLALLIYYAGIANSLGGLPGSPHTYVKAVFQDVGTLQPHDDVRQNSVRVGQVAAIGFERGHALVTLQLNGHRPVYRNARAEVWDQSALAVKYVELDPGTRAAKPLGDRTIPGTRTRDSVSLDQLFDVLDPPTRTALAGSVRELGVGTAGHGGDLHDLVRAAPTLLPDAQRMTAAASSPEADLPALLQSADRLTARFAGDQRQLSQLIAQADTTLRAVDTGGGAPLKRTLEDLPPALRQAQTAFDRLDRPLSDAQSALGTVRPGAQALGRSTADLRGTLREAVPPLRKVPGVADDAVPAVDSLTSTFADARPLVPRLTEALANALPFLQVLVPYDGDIAQFFAQKSMLGDHLGVNHWLRISVVAPYPQAEVGGLLPTLPRNPYPAPGQARKDRALLPVPVGGAK